MIFNTVRINCNGSKVALAFFARAGKNKRYFTEFKNKFILPGVSSGMVAGIRHAASVEGDGAPSMVAAEIMFSPMSALDGPAPSSVTITLFLAAPGAS